MNDEGGAAGLAALCRDATAMFLDDVEGVGELDIELDPGAFPIEGDLEQAFEIRRIENGAVIGEPEDRP